MKNSKDEPANPAQNARLSTLQSAGAILVVALFFLAFLWPWNYGPDAWFYQSLADLAHAVIFAIPPLFLLPLFRNRGWNWPRTCTITLAICLVAAFLVEFLQMFSGRNPSLWDALISFAGSLFAVSSLLFQSSPADWFSREKLAGIAGAFLAALLLITAVEPVSHRYRALQWRQENFPLLADFQDRRQFPLWVPLPAENPAQLRFEEQALHIFPSAAPFSGAAYRAGKQDWSAYNTLVLNLVNPHPDPLHLGLRIDDVHGSQSLRDRYQAPLMLSPGPQTLRIPLTEIFTPPEAPRPDPAAITRLALFTDPAHALPEPRPHWVLKELRLEKSP